MVLKLDMIQTVAVAVAVLFIGKLLKKKFSLLEKYCIPAPVVGGLLFAIMILAFRQTGVMKVEMNTTLQSVFMTAFFTSVGFTASFKLLKKGGMQVFLFLFAAVILVILQDIVGISLAKVFGLNPLLGLATGSVPMTGGHGTSAAFAPSFEELGAKGAVAVAVASATFGLVMGSMIGGPIAKRLIEKHKLITAPKYKGTISKEEVAATAAVSVKELIPDNFMSATSQIFIAMGIGSILSMLLQKTGVNFPSYIGAMFVAAIMRNISDSSMFIKLKDDEIDIIGNVSLSLFLSMALMSLKLWELASLALPLVVMLLAQTVLMAVFAIYVTFNIMGRDYEAAAITSGHCGFGMGATPNAMANMQALSAKYGAAPKAFFVVPLVGSLFIDFFNAGIITFFMNMFK
jgi:glutamate:Na+ symporter, ESS family